MRLASIEADVRYINLDRRTFECECGRTIGDFVARTE